MLPVTLTIKAGFQASAKATDSAVVKGFAFTAEAAKTGEAG